MHFTQVQPLPMCPATTANDDRGPSLRRRAARGWGATRWPRSWKKTARARRRRLAWGASTWTPRQAPGSFRWTRGRHGVPSAPISSTATAIWGWRWTAMRGCACCLSGATASAACVWLSTRCSAATGKATAATAPMRATSARKGVRAPSRWCWGSRSSTVLPRPCMYRAPATSARWCSVQRRQPVRRGLRSRAPWRWPEILLGARCCVLLAAQPAAAAALPAPQCYAHRHLRGPHRGFARGPDRGKNRLRRQSRFFRSLFSFGFFMSSIQVRPATLRDAKAIAQIHAVSAQEVYKGLVPDEQLKSMSVEKRQGFWREAIEYCEPQVQVAVDGEKIVGFVGYDRSRDEKSRPTTGEIWAIYAAPTHWNQGVGLALWDAARDGLQEEGCTNVTAWVPLRNERAIRFHELAGFKRELSTAKTAVVGGVKIEEVRLKRHINA